MLQPPPVTWLEIDACALAHNIAVLRHASQQGGHKPLLCVMVKGNAYGHGLLQAAQAFLQAGVDWLAVHDILEVQHLRESGVTAPLYCVGYISPDQAAAAVAYDLHLVLYDRDVLAALSLAAVQQNKIVQVHIKVETGDNRQGLRHDETIEFAKLIAQTPHVELEGMATHFADIEDTTDHRFAQSQLARFRQTVDATRQLLNLPPEGHADDKFLAHCSNSAALLLWPEVCGNLARCGIAAYGLWPSKETWLSVCQLGKKPVELRPALTWKTRLAQVRQVPAGEYIGYGRTYRAVRNMLVGILPIGYYDGYDRGLSNVGKVLLGGQRAPVVGRVAMNMTAIDLTDSKNARAGDEVVLIGAQNSAGGQDGDRISAEEFANWFGTIHYEAVTRIAERLPRVVVN